jgi:hypothetical protein
MLTDKIREDRLRRSLNKLEHRLEKTPARSWLREHYGPGYQVVDLTNTVVFGCWNRQYQATLDEVEAFALKLQTKAKASDIPQQNPGARV